MQLLLLYRNLLHLHMLLVHLWYMLHLGNCLLIMLRWHSRRQSLMAPRWKIEIKRYNYVENYVGRLHFICSYIINLAHSTPKSFTVTVKSINVTK
uniref:Putative secreted protein n=1 Tax=Panstrongylus lignarius TaxID=156445 RepID=A0A224Y3E9_9HEMI